MSLANHSFLSVEQLDTAELFSLFKTAKSLEPLAQGKVKSNLLSGAILANVFYEPSTRTRMSFDTAFARLGGHVNSFSATSSSAIKGESVADTARMISAYADIAVLRHPVQGSAKIFAEHASIPVVNGGDGDAEHPTQALLDCYTIAQYHPEISGITVAFTGDLKYGRAVHSLFRLLCRFDDITFIAIAPEQLQLPAELITLAEQSGHRIEFHSQPEDGIAHADIIYSTRIQQERFNVGIYEQIKSELFNINKAIIDANAKASAKILHPLPRDARAGAFDLSDDLDSDTRLVCFQQAANGVPVRMALFLHLFGIVPSNSDFTSVAWQH